MKRDDEKSRWDAFADWEIDALNEFFQSFGPSRSYSADIQKIGQEISAAAQKRESTRLHDLARPGRSTQQQEPK